jgi:hypothetical protein
LDRKGVKSNLAVGGNAWVQEHDENGAIQRTGKPLITPDPCRDAISHYPDGGIGSGILLSIGGRDII